MFLLSSTYWQIQKTKEKGRGVFAKKEIQKDTVIGDYLGIVIKTAEYDLDLDKNGLYLMHYTDEAAIYPDLNKPGLHLFNHSCAPNCWIYTHRGHTLFFALRNISPGEELTISYLLSPLDDTCNPCIHLCKCESRNCTGTMHISPEKYEKWQKFQQEKETTDVAPYTFGKKLPKLEIYPKTIPQDPIYEAMRS